MEPVEGSDFTSITNPIPISKNKEQPTKSEKLKMTNDNVNQQHCTRARIEHIPETTQPAKTVLNQQNPYQTTQKLINASKEHPQRVDKGADDRHRIKPKVTGAWRGWQPVQRDPTGEGGLSQRRFS